MRSSSNCSRAAPRARGQADDSSGVGNTPTGDVPPTDRAVSLDYIHLLRLRDGEHVSFNLMFARLLMLEQLGLIRVPAPAAQ